MPFKSFGFSSALLNTIEDQGFTEPYPIQQKVIPSVIKGIDVVGIAKTGSGKSAAYVLPILSKSFVVSKYLIIIIHIDLVVNKYTKFN